MRSNAGRNGNELGLTLKQDNLKIFKNDLTLYFSHSTNYGNNQQCVKTADRLIVIIKLLPCFLNDILVFTEQFTYIKSLILYQCSVNVTFCVGPVVKCLIQSNLF